MVEFAGKGVVGVHRFRLSPNCQRLYGGKGLVVFGTDEPAGSLLYLGNLQPLAKHEQCVVALRERVPQISTGTCAVVTIVYFAIAEMDH